MLVVHNDYGRYSGEEAVVDRMIADGHRFGYEIETLRRTSKFSRDNFVGKVHGFISGVFSISGRRMMREALRNFRPDIVHIHNLYPFISPAVLPLCRKAGVPVVMTVHNYRLICPTGLFLRDGRPCENCLVNGNERDCVRHNCEGSRLRSLGYAIRNMVARKSRAYLGCVNYFCCLTVFQKQKLIEAGFPAEKISVIPNYVEYVEPSGVPSGRAGSYIGYVGRLSHEKGYDMLIEVARRHPELQFRFAGMVRDDMAIATPPNVELCGQLPYDKLALFYSEARFMVIPSRCYEGFPMSLLEASSHGKPCVVPRHGAFPELVADPSGVSHSGKMFNPLDVDDLERCIMELWNNPNECERLGLNALKNYQTRFLRKDILVLWDKFLRRVVANHKKSQK